MLKQKLVQMKGVFAFPQQHSLTKFAKSEKVTERRVRLFCLLCWQRYDNIPSISTLFVNFCNGTIIVRN